MQDNKTLNFIKYQIRSHHNDFDEIREMEECVKFARYGALIMHERTLTWLESNLMELGLESGYVKEFINRYKNEI